jgi:hypothetical protein
VPGDCGTASNWTQFPGLPGTDGGYKQAIFVDSVSGSDDNSGNSPAEALQHVSNTSKLYKLLSSATDTSAILVLLKPGSSWPSEQLWVPVGGTAAYPLLISGSKWPKPGKSARPMIGGGIREETGSHVAIEGVEVGPYPDGGTFSSIGIDISVPGGTDYLIEDCLITHYYNLIQVSGSDTQPITNVRVRRSYLFGAYGSGPVVAFDGNDIVGGLLEDNFFDYNGGPDGDYLNDSLVAPYSNIFAHDVYFADDGMRVVAFDVNLRHNLFSRTLQSVKGPYSGVVDDNLFYDYQSGGYVGPWGASFTNNVLVNGGGFSASLDNAHDPNADAGVRTLFCNNLHYNEPSSSGSGAFSAQTLGSSIVGVNLDYVGNVIDGFEQAFLLQDEHCFGYTFADNVVQASQFFEISGTWPQPQCPLSVSHNAYHSPAGPDASGGSAYALEIHPSSTPATYDNYSEMEAYLHEDGGTYRSSPFSFSDPTRNITTYLTSSGLAPSSPAPTLIDYLGLIRAQAETAHRWNPALGVAAVNAYIRSGHSLGSENFTYSCSCP